MAEDRKVRSCRAPQSNERDLQEDPKKVSQVSILTPSEPNVALDHSKPSLSSLPDDVIANIISFLPSFSNHLTDCALRIAYSNLSLTCLNPRYVGLYANSFKNVLGLSHPSFFFSTLSTRIRSPSYLRKPFLSFLLRQCPAIGELSAPCISGVLQYVGKGIKDISFTDTGLTDVDLRFLSTSQLRCVTVINPSASLLVALSDVRTLETLELLRVHESIDLADFLSCTTATHLFLSFESPFLRDQVVAVFQALTRFKSFTFLCTRHHLWTLPYLRKLAITIHDVTMIIEGFKIFVRPSDPDEMSSTTWDDEVRAQLLFGDDLEFDDAYEWPVDVHLLRLDICHVLNALRQGVSRFRIFRLFDDYFERDDIQETPVALHLSFSRSESLPLLCRAYQIIRDFRRERIHTLTISYIYVIFAGQRQDVGAYRAVSWLFSDFEDLSTIEICAESADSTPCPLGKASLLSPRFIMGLVTFLRMATTRKHPLQRILLEEAGELVLQRTGVSELSDEKTVKRLIHSVIVWVKKLEEEKNLELGSIVGQLQYWASKKLRKVDRSELDDVQAIRHLALQQYEDLGYIIDSEICELA